MPWSLKPSEKGLPVQCQLSGGKCQPAGSSTPRIYSLGPTLDPFQKMWPRNPLGHLGEPLAELLSHVSAISRARAIKYRQENQEAVGGFFSQIGELYVVHHLWGRLETPKLLSVTL